MTKPSELTWQGQSQSPQQTMLIGKLIGERAGPGDLVALSGELGGGKTVLVRGLAQALGIDPHAIASPTYVLVHEYRAAAAGPLLVHVDAYRLQSLDDLESIGWDRPACEMRRDALLVVEWADRLGEELGDDYLAVQLDHAGENERLITLSGCGSWEDRFDKLRQSLDAAMAAPPQDKPRPCPICKKPTEKNNPTYPFCSDRCRTIDLGRWADGRYVLSRPIEHSDIEEGE